MDKTSKETQAEKKEKGEHFDESKKELAASDKGSWFDQPSSDVSGVSHPSTSREVGASSVKLMASKASTSGLAESDSTSGDESNGSTESEELECEDEANTWTVVDHLKINRKLQEIASCRFCGTDEIRVDEESRCGLGQNGVLSAGIRNALRTISRAHLTQLLNKTVFMASIGD